ncbi:MAG: rod shape-determining protein RodA [Clostridia bacterium]|nr:rod shape-determining protein RodA [Clostridia bacterium]
MINKRALKNYFQKLDYILLLTVFFLAVIGMVAIFSAGYSQDAGTRQMIVQTVAALMGIGLMFFLTWIDYESYSEFAKYIYIGSIIILLFVLFFGMGKEETGANSWIRIGSVGIQPSELVKIAFAITFSTHVTKVKENINSVRNILALFAHFAILFALVILQNDTGTALVFLVMFLMILFVAGVSYKYFLAAIGVGAASLPLLWFLLSDYQKNRILVFLNPEIDPAGAGFQVIQSKIAIGSGQVFGRGYMQGPQNQLSMLPEKDTDFIYGVIGEEFGFIGTILVLALLLVLICRCIYVARHAKNDMGTYICIGIAAMYLFHTFENICMCIGLMPVTGIPLPFLSYGGSSILTNFIAIGLVQSVWSRRRVINFGD